MKKGISLLVAFIMCCLYSVSCFALSAQNGTLYTYVFPNGVIVEYYVDDDGHPYNYDNGEKIFLSLPLEQFIVTDQKLIDEIKNSFSLDGNSVLRSEPASYYDISNVGLSLTSSQYTKSVSFANYQTFTTPWIKISPRHSVLHFRTDDIEKPLFGSNKVSYVLRFYYVDMDIVTQEIFNDVDCRAAEGRKHGYLTQHRYCQLALLIPDDVTAYKAVVWTTAG